MTQDSTPIYLERAGRGRLACVYSPASGVRAGLPAAMFLGGFRSDMGGSKALYLEESCRMRGQQFVRFDYTGHGLSAGRFEEGCIGDWRDDARDVLDQVVQGPVVLVGSSMGGWISLLLLLERTERIRGVVGIAAAPDFTRTIEGAFTPAQRQDIETQGFIEAPSAYGDPYMITRRLIEDGRRQCVLDRTHRVRAPMTLIHGKLDADVPWETAEAIKSRFEGPQTKILYIEDGEHRLSRPEDLALIAAEVEAMSLAVSGSRGAGITCG